MPANFYATPYGLSCIVAEWEGSKEKLPGLVLFYRSQLGSQIQEKILPLIREDDALVCVVEQQGGGSEISLFLVVNCSEPVEFDITSLPTMLAPGKDLTVDACKKIVQKKKIPVYRFISGMEIALSKEQTEIMMELEKEAGCFVVMLGKKQDDNSVLCFDRHFKQNRVFHSKNEFKWIFSEKCGVEPDYWKV